MKPGAPTKVAGAPTIVRALGDTEAKALAAFIKSGDFGGVKEARIGDHEIDLRLLGRAFKASNDTDLNITTAADGGYAVPTGHFNRIIAKAGESSIPDRLGVLDIPGRGTTVNVPIDNGTANEFVATNEAAAYDRDAPAIGQQAMTLVKYTKKVELTEELLDDEDSALMSFLENYVGRAKAVTDNKLLVTECEASGTDLGSWASASAVAAAKLEEAVYHATLAYYLDNSRSVAWLMRPPTFAAFINLTGNSRLYAPQVQGSNGDRPTLLGYPVYFSNQVDAIGASGKSVIFGNFGYMGRRQGGLSVLRDPYSGAGNGFVRLWYRMRADYEILQAGAIGYIDHPSA
jgi:HK97 family phage major capsid protein